MRSSRSGPDPLDPGPAGFAHRGLHDGATFIENTLLACAAAIERGAGMEVDLRLTADNRLVVFHDADALRLCGSFDKVGEKTLAELARLRVGDHTIPTLEQLLALIDGRVPVLLEVKIDDRFWRHGPALLKALETYRGPLGVMSYDPRLARWLKTNAPHILRGIVIADRLAPLKRRFALWLADPDFVAVEQAALGKKWVANLRKHARIYAWTVATPEQRKTAAIHADASIWEADGRP